MKKLTLMIFALLFSGCAANPALELESAVDVPCELEESRLIIEFDLPKKIEKKCDFPLNYQVLQFSKVDLPNSFLRAGPGIKFDLGAQSFKKGEWVIVTSTEKKWRKVTDLSLKRVGWLHEKMLTTPPNQDILKSDIAQMGLEIPFENFSFAFPWKHLVTADSIKIPKGSKLPILNYHNNKVTVWDPRYKRTHVLAKRWLK